MTTPEDRPGPGPAAEPPGHEETGLELARSIARSLGQARGRVRRGGRTRRTPSSPPQVSGAHPDDRDPQLLDSAMARLVADRGWGAEIRVHGVFSRWDAIVGRDVAAHARPVAFTRDDDGSQAGSEAGAGGRLTVQADSTAWATQMRLLAGTVVRRLNEVLGDGTVRVIDVRGPDAPSWKHGRRSLRDGRGPRDTYG